MPSLIRQAQTFVRDSLLTCNTSYAYAHPENPVNVIEECSRNRSASLVPNPFIANSCGQLQQVVNVGEFAIGRPTAIGVGLTFLGAAYLVTKAIYVKWIKKSIDSTTVSHPVSITTVGSAEEEADEPDTSSKV